MKTVNKNLELARLENPTFYHVVNSNEVHSYENLEDAENDLKEAIDNELKYNTGFSPSIHF